MVGHILNKIREPPQILQVSHDLYGIDRFGTSAIAPAPIAPPMEPVRNHDAFLNGYAPEDEGLYDDYLAG